LTLAFVENSYIFFWVSKDLFWSWGTGDLVRGRNPAIVFETAALMFGTSALCVYSITAYLHRRNLLRFADTISTMCWLSANFVWMCGEFFIRYQNLDLDDTSAGNDGETRIASSCLFMTGLLIQCGIIVTMFINTVTKRGNEHGCFENESSGRRSSFLTCLTDCCASLFQIRNRRKVLSVSHHGAFEGFTSIQVVGKSTNEQNILDDEESVLF